MSIIWYANSHEREAAGALLAEWLKNAPDAAGVFTTSLFVLQGRDGRR